MESLLNLPFVKAMLQAIANCTDFKGRTGRKDFWWAVLGFVIVSAIVGFVLGFLGGLTGLKLFSWLTNLVSIAIALLELAMCVRRLHDVNKSGWCLLLGLVPIVGAIILLIWEIKEGDPTDNQYGPVPQSIT